MHNPSKGSKQTIATVIADLEAQHARLAQAITWTKNIGQAITACGPRVTYTNVGPIEVQTREVGIALSLPTGSLFQDVPVFTLVCTPTESDLAAMRRETALAGEALRLMNLLNWQAQGIRVFETWFVSEQTLWQGSPEATQVFLNREVKAWLGYWFEQPPSPVFRPRANHLTPAVRVR